MKSIIFKTIIFIVILIVSFFIIKYLLSREKRYSNIKENLVIEDFQSSDSINITDLETVFGMNAVDNDFFGYDITEIRIDTLQGHFLYPKEFIDINNEVDRGSCLTKYLGIYNLIVTESFEFFKPSEYFF